MNNLTKNLLKPISTAAGLAILANTTGCQLMPYNHAVPSDDVSIHLKDGRKIRYYKGEIYCSRRSLDVNQPNGDTEEYKFGGAVFGAFLPTKLTSVEYKFVGTNNIYNTNHIKFDLTNPCEIEKAQKRLNHYLDEVAKVEECSNMGYVAPFQVGITGIYLIFNPERISKN